MQSIPEKRRLNIGRALTDWAFCEILHLYPKSYQNRFSIEMQGVFNEALDDLSHGNLWATLIFLFREFKDAPSNILKQHLAADSFWSRPLPLNILAYTLGFASIGLEEALNESQILKGQQITCFYLLSCLLAGALGGLAIGVHQNSHSPWLFITGGSAGFLVANILTNKFTVACFPRGFSSSAQGILFFAPLLCPILTGAIFGLFIGMMNGKLSEILSYSCGGSLALLAGFTLNRLSAALLQSFLFHSSTQNIAQFGILAFLATYLLEGASVGIVLGSIVKKHSALKAPLS